MLEGYTLELDRPLVMGVAEKFDGRIRWVPNYPTKLLFGRFATGDKIRLDYPDGSTVDVVRVSHPENGYKIIEKDFVIKHEDIPIGTIAREYIPNIRAQVA